MKILTKVYTTTTIQDKKDCYYSPILDNDNFYYSHNTKMKDLRELLLVLTCSGFIEVNPKTSFIVL
jgi:hypothetical protein